MELRKTEQELTVLVDHYKCLCHRPLRKRTSSGDVIDNGISTSLTTWKDLCTSRQNEKIQNQVEVPQPMVEENSDHSGADISVKELLDALVDLKNRFISLEPRVVKFRSRLTMKDPVTNAPRYGKKTIDRVKNLLEMYETLHVGIDTAFDSEGNNSTKGSIVNDLQQALQSEEEYFENAKLKENAAKLKIEAEQREKELLAELERKRNEEIERINQEREKEELSRRAEEARTLRIENEQRAVVEAREAERAFLASVEVGIDGIKHQLQTLKESCSKAEFDVAKKALHTIFAQIVSKPEETQFRRIRCDHPKFMADIGRHNGGKEFLVAASFTFKEIDEVKCFFTAEPDLMSDMDGWSSWFDLMKATLQHLDEELKR
jgi:DNA repair exonuclease SbcCD ATPase subunit